eukprot:GHUV01026601.1.p1 GENE.GHUV01026601.1~~GHUV01026601.1.p1  ORF type:complete len:107 (+),score=14.82 GHUV01026601.1:166-486(+)
MGIDSIRGSSQQGISSRDTLAKPSAVAAAARVLHAVLAALSYNWHDFAASVLQGMKQHYLQYTKRTTYLDLLFLSAGPAAAVAASTASVLPAVCVSHRSAQYTSKI